MRTNQETVTPELPAILGAGALAAAALALSFLAASMAGSHRSPAPAAWRAQTQPAVRALAPVAPLAQEVAPAAIRLGGL